MKIFKTDMSITSTAFLFHCKQFQFEYRTYILWGITEHTKLFLWYVIQNFTDFSLLHLASVIRNKFTTEQCQHFPTDLHSVSTLPCEICN